MKPSKRSWLLVALLSCTLGTLAAGQGQLVLDTVHGYSLESSPTH